MADETPLAIGATIKKLCCCIGVLLFSSFAWAGDPAWPGHHPLTEVQSGNLLISELRCASCHSGVAPNTVPEKQAPDLSDVGSRVFPAYLQRFLESPAAIHAGTTMPDMLAAKPATERRAIAESLTHFLVASSNASQSKPLSSRPDRERGKLLYHTVGCVACHGAKEPAAAPNHSPSSVGSEDDDDEGNDEDEAPSDPTIVERKKIKPINVSIGHVAAKYSVSALGDFLFQPLRVRKSGRMPDMKLTPEESNAIAAYLCGDDAPLQFDTNFQLSETLVQAGKKQFQELNCSACHSLPGFSPAVRVGELRNADLTRGCLSSGSERSSILGPRFSLEENELAAIRTAIRSPSTPETDASKLAISLTAFRCVACHVRDDYGGVHETHNPYFKGSELNLGDDGRIPPPLTLMGAKLQPNWLKKVLFDGESVRQYMATRMPQYGVDNLQELPALFQRLDSLSGPDMKIPNPESQNEAERQHEKMIRSAGRELLGDKGANCVACHKFNGKAANVNQGIDLLTSYERLQPAWFYHYLLKPGSFRPRTVMPTSWPDGVSAFKTVLDGNTDRQIEAIWYYLSLGTSAADPPGVRSVSTKISVGDHAVLHRGRSRVAGFRGIAVGLPEKLNYAFNAETGTLSAIWRGDFIGVNWSGQGAGDFNPVSEPLLLSQDVSFAALKDSNSPWPLMPAITKEAPENPNPLYPKNVGYQFRGYHLDEDFLPTFRYQSGTIEILDRSAAVLEEERPALKRVMTLQSPTPQSIWFRALVGDVRSDSPRVFTSDQLQLTIPEVETHLRPMPDGSNRFELLLHLQIPQGQTSVELTYELLKK